VGITKVPTVPSEEIQADNLISPVEKSSHAGVKSAFVGVESANGSTQVEGQALSKLKPENPLGKHVKFVPPIKNLLPF